MTAADPLLRAWLGPIADALIPAVDPMPAATEVGVTGEQLDLVLTSRPDLLRDLRRAVVLTGQSPPAETLSTLAELDPAAHQAVLDVVAAGYYAHPRVRELIGYTGQQPTVLHLEDWPAYLSEGLLERVVDRGPIYRPDGS
jgi:hypothetical protein